MGRKWIKVKFKITGFMNLIISRYMKMRMVIWLLTFNTKCPNIVFKLMACFIFILIIHFSKFYEVEDSLNIAIIGYGKMGRMIECIAVQKGHTVKARIDPHVPEADAPELDASLLVDTDVCIEFTHPDSVMDNIKSIIELKKQLVVGTTGWLDRIEEVKKWEDHAGAGLIYAPNFSLGVNLFYRMIEHAAELMNQFPDYDISGMEVHHNRKADAPSGTARILADKIIDKIDRKNKVVFDLGNRKIGANELHFPSLRCGSVTGMHQVLFDSSADSIELKHTARNREGFALGALQAAQWIMDKKGVYSIDDMMDDIL